MEQTIVYLEAYQEKLVMTPLCTMVTKKQGYIEAESTGFEVSYAIKWSNSASLTVDV